MAPQQQEPIAIVGSACRFPGNANSPSALWQLLQSPRDVGVEIGPDRFDAKAFYHPDGSHHGTSNVLRSYLLQEDVRSFDAAFFNLSPNEADSMDPQQRILLETVYEALEAGGHAMESLRGSDTAVYVGTMTADWNDTQIRDHNTMPKYYATGTNRAIISNRVSYFFDWHGPSMTIDTACSSSLVALHQSVQALRSGESRVAVACGTQLLLGPEMYIGESKLKMLSPNGRSAMWDASADGYARGEGVAAVMVKRLSDAIADGDHIECIVRETGANQDGFSNGLTVPNSDAQAALIQQTYARAGLDPKNVPRDRPQFFEAHGTGTQAGDPKEAAAIYECFGRHITSSETPLYVGSVKTVIGHLEGCAGLAGVLKGAAMIQAGQVPPNLHFHRLNPKLEPFYHGLQVPTQLASWPQLPEGGVRRVSVNSFGFGGTNAHAILEQYQIQAPVSVVSDVSPTPSVSIAPFVFSASSELGLVSQLQVYSSYLKAHSETLRFSDLAWTLHTRRSQLSTKAAFAATSIEQLASKIDARLVEVSQKPGETVGLRSNTNGGTPRLLGVFTGQGAQWAAMGAQLIHSSSFVRERIVLLEDSLNTLPPADRPTWRLQDEMMALDPVSRIGEAALSQPLCTAVQVVLVDLLRAAGISFAAVVGHSSGEIGAAYAAGFLTAKDAIRIAYYRGLYANLAGNKVTGQKGAMLAAGISRDDADELANSPAFKGRIAVAAHNSPASVTLSGDADAILEAKSHFDERKQFARLLKVDTAYHSHHMLPCCDLYVKALKTCNVQVIQNRADTSCSWYSSVSGSAEPVQPSDFLQAEYWRDNMLNAVLFADAVKNTVAKTERIDLAIEVGPHPALKGPAMQNIAEVQTSPIPYCGALSRGRNDVEAFSEALAFLWVRLPHFVNLPSLGSATSAGVRPHLVKSLPSYQWNHTRSHWSESRISKRMRTRKQAHHEILGFLSTDSNSRDMRWLNVLKRKEIPWLDGHQLQGQTVFPAAGYVAMALESSRALAGDKPVELIELHQLTIPRAIAFEEGDDSDVETLVTLTGVEHHTDRFATADFACYSVPVLSSGAEQDMELSASGTVKIIFGTPDFATLPASTLEDYNMTTVDAERFYATISELGYNYSGSFRTLSSPKRKLNQASALVGSYPYGETVTSDYLVHPSMLDVSLHAAMLAYSAPGDRRLWSLMVPTSIGTIRVNPEVCAALPTSGSNVPVCASIDDSGDFSASIDLFSEDSQYGMVQIEDLIMRPFAPATGADDRVIFTNTKFGLAIPDGNVVMKTMRPSAQDVEVAGACERIAYYHLRRWKSELSNPANTDKQERWMNFARWMDSTLSATTCGRHPTLKKEWSEDTAEQIQALILKYADSIDVKLLAAVDSHLLAAAKGDTALEQMIPEELLKEWYEAGLGFAEYNSLLAGGIMKQVTHRYPHAKILQLGAGTRGATKSILESIGHVCSSYTYTDRSEGSFTEATSEFKKYSDKLKFSILDIEQAPSEQGFKQNSYDIVVASHVLTTSSSLKTALENVRTLLRPGGYLVLTEFTNPNSVRHHNILSTLPGWWLGANDGRQTSPLLTPGAWHNALRKAGFSGVDTRSPENEGTAWPMSIIVSQAVDERIQFLRRPLSSPSPASLPPFHIESLVILGNGSLETAHISERLSEQLERFCGNIAILDGLPTEEESQELAPMSTFLNLVDLDSPIFNNMTDEKMDGLKRMLELAKHVVWVTCGGHQDQPYQMASIAFGRSIRQEAGHINFSHMDISDLQHDATKALAEYVVQQSVLDDWAAPPSALADPCHQDCEFLWSREPEVVLDNRKLMLPRLLPNTAQNARLNSSRRVISGLVPASKATIETSSPSHNLPLSIVEQAQKQRVTSHNSKVKIQSSSLKALCITAKAYLFLGVSEVEQSKVQVVLSEANSREVAPVASVCIPIEDGIQADTDSILVAVASELIADNLVRLLSSDSRVLVHCSSKDRFLAAALTRCATKQGAHVTLTCDDTAGKPDSSWTLFNTRMSTPNLRKTLRLLKPTHYLDLTSGVSRGAMGERITKALASTCVCISSSALFQHESSLRSLLGASELLSNSLTKAVSTAINFISEASDQVTSLADARTLHHEHATSTIHWPSDGLVEADVRALSAQNLFSREKTYLLVGLTGQIGQSLCEWMVSNGAGCVCLTSRRPKVDPRWLQSFEGTGATVKVLPMDVLDRTSIEKAVQDIRASCPPIAGVANGAVIFDDSLFANMSGDMMRRVLAAKVDGSKALDDIFYNDDLDFFILFSSVVCVYGNPGQSNYTAANGFLNALARQRRRRGLAASALVLGLVAGIGHAESAGAAVQDQLVKKMGMPPISETELRQLFAETILTGFQQPEDLHSVPQVEVIAGLRDFQDDEDLKGPWFSNPYFSHLIKESNNNGAGSDGQDKQAALPVNQRLATATTTEEALDILQDCFATRLRSMLQLGDQKIEYEAPLLELGIDSLVAVEVRSWFLKELTVDIPVLKIVGGASLSELCKKALEKLPKALAVTVEKVEINNTISSKAVMDKPDTQPKASVESKRATVNSRPSSSDGTSETSERGSGTATPASSVTTSSPIDSVETLQKLSFTETKQVKTPTRKFLKSEPISLPQSRFWFLRQLLEDPTTPNVVISWRVAGNVRVGDLERAVRLVTNRHEALRTCFEEENSVDGAYQNVLPSSPMRLERVKINSAEDADIEYAKLRSHVFDLEKGDVMKLVLLTQSPSEHYLMVNYHHIIMDGGSFNVFFSDLEKAYMGQSLGPSPRQYPEFSVAQRRALENGEMQGELDYWRSVFPAGEQPPVLPLLPMARACTRVPMNGFDTHQVVSQLSPGLVARVRSVSKTQRSTPFHLHLAAFKTMLFCLADDTDDLTIGIADAARNDSSIEKSVGFFLNLLTLRFKRQPAQTFADAIVEARGTAHAALESSRLPFDILLSELSIARSSSHSPFFQAFLDYRQGAQERHPWGNCQFEFQGVHPGRTAYDITLDVTDWNATDSRVVIRVQKSLYDLTAANLLLDTYIHFLEVVTEDALLTLQATPTFGEKQLDQAVQIGRGLNLESDWPATLPHRIDQIGKDFPDRVALMDGTGKTLTYSDMSNRIESISETLRNFGVAAGSRVLVYQQPAADWTCSMLAIMRIGAVYVPLDLRNPVSRLSAVAKDCEASAILADNTTLDEAPSIRHGDARIINVSTLALAASQKIEVLSQANSPAAILYTSGSTGTPKGIVVTHAGLRNEIEGYTKQWGLSAERVLQQSAFTFNHSSDQMYTGLVNGGMVFIVPAEKRGDPMEITKIMQQHSITYTKATPSEYSMWIRFGGETLRKASSWRFAFGGGEALTTVTTDEFASLNLPQLRFFNSYGPTEISISSHKMEIQYRDNTQLKKMGRIPCGYSLPNYYTYVVDQQLRPVPVGMPGEICIGGAGVSLGYLNNQELSSKHFVTNPFATAEDVARGWTRMYRTNDIGHLQEDGAMVFHSRMAGDSQVKIRGLRIELSDIESNIISAGDGMLREAVVTLREGDPPFLVVHVTCTEKLVSDKDAFLRNLLSRLPLPQYMIPVMAIPLEKFPLNNHSKVDRKAVLKLQLPERVSEPDEAVELSETMMQLKHVWRDVLGANMDRLGIQLTPSSDFFLLGGNSLLIIRVAERIRQVFRVVIPLFELMSDTTLGGMARKIEENLGVELIDWEQETCPPSVPQILDNLPAKNNTTTKTVLVTGATGFLGRFVLPELAARPDVGTIHCIAVRDKPREGTLFTSPKVLYHMGDLSLPLFGLSEADYRDLASEVDVILHLGAVRSFWDNYHVLRPSNVDSVKELVKLAAPNQVPIHFISTIGVLPEDVEATVDDAGSAVVFAPSTDGSEGYVASKWAGECILERSAESLGVPAYIYRFLPASSQLASQKQELMQSFVGCVDTLGSKPDMGIWNGRIDMVPAEQAAQWLSKSVMEVNNATAKATFTHYESPLTVHTDELSAYIGEERADRVDFQPVPVLKWLGQCKTIGFNYLIASQQATIGDGQGGQTYQSRR